MNGAAALLIKRGEEIIVMGFELTDKPIEPSIILVDKNNRGTSKNPEIKACD
jgi:aspartate 1-decarboxylase